MSGWPVVDSVQFAKLHAAERCTVAVSEFKRLAQVVLGDRGKFEVGLDGFEDSEGRPCLHLHVEGNMTITCQRCLEPLELVIASDRRFVLTETEQELMDLGEEADDVDSMLADSRLDALLLAEDEILLQIPMAPTHDEGTCDQPQWSSGPGNESSPFSVLGALTNTKD